MVDYTRLRKEVEAIAVNLCHDDNLLEDAVSEGFMAACGNKRLPLTSATQAIMTFLRKEREQQLIKQELDDGH